VHAKLLTGGLVPLCCTVASQSIFDAFLGDEKADALLHGHSYTAHAVGCKVALESVEWMVGMEKNGEWDAAKKDWMGEAKEVSGEDGMTVEAWSVWEKGFVGKISFGREVESVIALGSVLAINLRDKNAGEFLPFSRG